MRTRWRDVIVSRRQADAPRRRCTRWPNAGAATETIVASDDRRHQDAAAPGCPRRAAGRRAGVVMKGRLLLRCHRQACRRRLVGDCLLAEASALGLGDRGAQRLLGLGRLVGSLSAVGRAKASLGSPWSLSLRAIKSRCGLAVPPASRRNATGSSSSVNGGSCPASLDFEARPPVRASR